MNFIIVIMHIHCTQLHCLSATNTLDTCKFILWYNVSLYSEDIDFNFLQRWCEASRIRNVRFGEGPRFLTSARESKMVKKWSKRVQKFIKTFLWPWPLTSITTETVLGPWGLFVLLKGHIFFQQENEKNPKNCDKKKQKHAKWPCNLDIWLSGLDTNGYDVESNKECIKLGWNPLYIQHFRGESLENHVLTWFLDGSTSSHEEAPYCPKLSLCQHWEIK